MKHNFKLKERLGALLLAMLFILQAILGLVPVCVTQAAPLTVETWDSDKVVDYGYRFNMKFQPGITTYESFGCDNLDREAFSDNGKSERDTECVRVGADYKAGSAGMRYNNVGKDGNGNIVDVRLILVGVENAGIVQLAKSAAENARMIVKEFQGYTETEKLYGYKEMICYLTSYNDDVTEDDEYGDPWQLIYVFDGDDSTNVVCEGYSKAFQYLCDLSDITCYTVTGIMNGGTGEGPHMWNIVANNGKYYMADITNSDEGTVGEDGGLFLDTPISGSISRGYTYATDSANIYFAYDKEAKSLYGTGKNSILYMTKETYSADDLTAKPAKTSITGISNRTAGKLVITWKKAKSADGYEIYRRAGTTNPYVRAAVIKSGSITKYTNAKLKKGHTYYYRIRSYRYDENGRKIYSGWSTVKKQKVK